MLDDLAEEYHNARYLPNGKIAAVRQFLFTAGICADMDEFGYSRRWCYQHARDAIAALEKWDGTGDPPGPWIKYKGQHDERLGPGAIDLNVEP